MKELSLLTDKIFGRYAILIRYVTSGSSAFATNIIVLYLLTEYLKIYYLVSAVVAFFTGFIVSFIMMKHWTFQDSSMDGINRQLTLYFGVTAVNLFLNTFFIYVFVEYVGIWYLLAQVFASLLIAISSFFVYKFLIFVKPSSTE